MSSKLRVFIPLFAALILVLLLWYLPVSRTDEVLPLRVEVTNARQIGVYMTNETQQQIDFGVAFPGAVITRRINLSRGDAPPAAVHVAIEGAIAPWLTPEPHDFQLGEPTQVALSLTIPKGAAEGRYSGTLTVRYTTTLGSKLVYWVSRMWRE
jgi:hypothetical protein